MTSEVIEDQFTFYDGKYCNIILHPVFKPGNIEACMLICIATPECEGFSWYQALKKCRICETNAIYSNVAWDAYLLEQNHTKKIREENFPVFNTYEGHAATASVEVILTQITETQCWNDALLLGYQGVQYKASVEKCKLLSKWTSMAVDATTNLKIRPKIWQCLPEIKSCYAIVNTEDILTYEEAQQTCHKHEGKMATMETEQEFQAVAASASFNILKRDLWLGLTYQEDGWTWDDNTTVTWTLPFSTTTANVGDAAVKKSGASTLAARGVDTEQAVFCEFGAITTAAMSWMPQQEMFELNDGSDETGYESGDHIRSAASLIKTRNLNYNPTHANMLVRLTGYSFSSCDVISVMLKSEKQKHMYEKCAVGQSYTWESTTTCLYNCNCNIGLSCQNAYLKTPTNITICEFQIL